MEGKQQLSYDLGGMEPNTAANEEAAGGKPHKSRKPYTMTKQRERWTEDEHHRFVEALKVHGRQWRKIEEVVKTKTAVQIRSHAQKFFSKVEKQKKQAQEGQAAPPDVPLDLAIPPPRPKRRANAPYPRKHGSSDDLEHADTCLLGLPDYAAAIRSSAINDVTVAAVTAAASAAAAAAAAAVVAAAGKEIEAKLHAAPPSVFPFYGMTPTMLRAMSNPATLQANIQATVNNVAANKRAQGANHHGMGAERTGTSQPGRELQPARVHGEDGEDSACSREDADMMVVDDKPDAQTELKGTIQGDTARLLQPTWPSAPFSSALLHPASLWGAQLSDPASMAMAAQLWNLSDSVRTGTMPGAGATSGQPASAEAVPAPPPPQKRPQTAVAGQKKGPEQGSKSTDGQSLGDGSTGDEDNQGLGQKRQDAADMNEGSGSNPTGNGGNGNGVGSSMYGSVHPNGRTNGNRAKPAVPAGLPHPARPHVAGGNTNGNNANGSNGNGNGNGSSGRGSNENTGGQGGSGPAAANNGGNGNANANASTAHFENVHGHKHHHANAKGGNGNGVSSKPQSGAAAVAGAAAMAATAATATAATVAAAAVAAAATVAGNGGTSGGNSAGEKGSGGDGSNGNGNNGSGNNGSGNGHSTADLANNGTSKLNPMPPPPPPAAAAKQQAQPPIPPKAPSKNTNGGDKERRPAAKTQEQEAAGAGQPIKDQGAPATVPVQPAHHLLHTQAVQAAMQALHATGMHQLILQQQSYLNPNYPLPSFQSSMSGYEAFTTMQQHIAAQYNVSAGGRPWPLFPFPLSNTAQDTGGDDTDQEHPTRQQQQQTDGEHPPSRAAPMMPPVSAPVSDRQVKSTRTTGQHKGPAGGRSGSTSHEVSGDAKKRSNSGSPRPSGGHRKKSKPVPSDNC